MKLFKPAFFIVLLFFASVLSTTAQKKQRPNILLIMADDLGYSDLGSYGGEINTPNLDKLADQGLRFTQMYNYARCSPSRASLLTGLYPSQAGIGFFAGNRPDNPWGYRGYLQPNVVTVAEVLMNSGYRTSMTGKWHVGHPVPTDQGFDEFYGFTQGYAVNSWNQDMMVRQPKGHSTIQYSEDEFFASDAFTDYALRFIKSAENDTPDEPWFSFVSYQAPHFPLQAPEKYIEKYEGTYEAGWDQLRKERLMRMKELGVIDENTELSPLSLIPRPKVAKRHGVSEDLDHNPAWETLPEDRKKDLARRMAVYAGMIDNMDHNIGRIINYLDSSGQLDNTLIIFVSDNGACAEWGPYGFDLTQKQLVSDKKGVGIKAWTPGLPSTLHQGSALDQMGGPGTGIAYGSGWANLSNTPWRKYKHYTNEGGIATPMIVHWPKKITTKAEGSFRRQPATLFDITATVVDAGQARYPKTQDGQKIIPLEGKSLLPVINGKSFGKRTLLFEHEGNAAIRQGKWKLVADYAFNKKHLTKWRLYNLQNDRTELVDLSGEHPEIVERLIKLFIKEANRTLILPKPK